MNRLAFILVLTVGATFFSCKQKPTPPTPPTPVNLITVTAQRVLYYDKYPATTVALNQVTLNAQVTGYITRINFTEGSHVHKGQLLYELDDRLYRASFEQAKANLRVDSGNLQLVQQDADRYQYLAKHNAVATQVVDHAMIQLKNAKDSVQAAQEQLKTAQTNLTYANIYAPFEGTIGISQVRLGNLVSAGTTVLNTISTDDPMGVDVQINEAALPHFEDLQQKGQKTVDSLFTIILPNQQLYPQVGKIAFIDRAVDPQTGAIDVRLTFPNSKTYLRPGMSTVLRVHNQDAAPQLVVPSRAVVEQMGEYFLFIAKDTVLHGAPENSASGGGSGGGSGSGGGAPAAGTTKDTPSKKEADTVETPKLRAFQVKVQLGQTVGANVIIKSGIHEGDRIVVDGVQALHDGGQINASSKAAGGGKGTPGAKEQTDSSKNK